MQNKAVATLLAALLLATLLAGCSQEEAPATGDSQELAEMEAQIQVLQDEVAALEAQVEGLLSQLESLTQTQPSGSLLMAALEVVDLLDSQDLDGLAAYVHPTKGVRFSPYTYVNLQEDLVFSAQDLPNLFASTQVFSWGAYDGTGDPIDLTFSDYFDRFVYDEDYANPEMIGINTVIGTGNTIVNLDQAYPDGSFVEFHFTGFEPDFIGLDWRSLRLVFEEVNSVWYLVAVVHDEWTI